jgi:osmotically-inducible protein OsmY
LHKFLDAGAFRAVFSGSHSGPAPKIYATLGLTNISHQVTGMFTQRFVFIKDFFSKDRVPGLRFRLWKILSSYTLVTPSSWRQNQARAYLFHVTCGLLLLLLSSLLSGCAPALVAGAATGVAITQDRRTVATMFDDEAIEFKVASRIRSDEALTKQVHINVTVYNAVVLLTGEAPTDELRAKVIAYASGVDNVKRVYNAIEIAPPTPFRSRNNDVWITSKVKTLLLGNREVEGTRIKVVTENGTVYLMGLIPREQGNAAADIASQVQNVKRVVKLFEYTDK